MIEELLDQYHVDDFDNLLIEIINQMIERKREVYGESTDEQD